MRSREVIGHKFVKITILLSLFACGTLIFIPFIWVMVSSFKDAVEIFSIPPTLIPRKPTLINFRRIMHEIPFHLFFINTFKISILITIGQLFTCSLSAYAFARMEFPGRDFLFLLFLTSIMLPPQVTIIPTFVLMRYFGLLNTHASLIWPALVSAFGTFLLRQYFLTIPKDLEDAAKMDGASPFRIYYSIFLPLSSAALAMLAIFCFNYFWNEFFRPLVFINTLRKMTLPLGIFMVQGRYGAASPGLLLAGATIAVFPVLIIFIFGQRYIVEGITLTGLKG